MSDIDKVRSEEDMNVDRKTPGAPGAVVVTEDPAAPSREVSSKRQSLSDLFTIVRTCFSVRYNILTIASSAPALPLSAMATRTIL